MNPILPHSVAALLALVHLGLAPTALAQMPTRLADAHPGAGSSTRSDQLLWMHPSGQFGLAILEDGTAGDEVWRTDGTVAGTRLLFDHFVSHNHQGITPVRGTIAGQFWFVDLAGSGGPAPSLWSTDGLGSQPTQVVDGATAGVEEFGVGAVAWRDEALCFARASSSAPWELWRIDPNGQHQAIWIDSMSSSALGQPWILDAFGGSALFITASGDLHVTDGTAPGTSRVIQGSPSYFGRALGGYQVHQSVTLPGPIPGTRISIVRAGRPTQSFTFATQRLLAYGLGKELWVLLDDRDLVVIDAAGTSASVATFVPGTGPDFRNLYGLTDLGDRKIFFADGGNGAGRELWRSDGTAAGTTMVIDLATGPADLPVDNGVQVAQHLVFWAALPGLGSEPWISDGTAAGTSLLGDLEPGSGSSSVAYWFWPTTDSAMLAVRTSAHGLEPWLCDGTTAGTRLLGDLRPGPESSLSIDPFSALFFGAVVGGHAVFAADDGVHGTELWSAPLPAYRMPVARLECALGAELTIGGWPSLGGSIAPAMHGLGTSDRGVLLASLPAPTALLHVDGCGLHLDPAALVAVGAVVPNSAGDWTTSLPVPNQSALLGLQLGVQAVLVDPSALIGLRPTEAWRVTLGR
ncbi:MAG: hypothetical protein AB7I19_15750 [Planctomycetota bacterium]